MPRTTTRRLRCLVDFTPALEGLPLVGVEVGPSHEVLALAQSGQPGLVILRYQGALTRTTIPGDGGGPDYVQPLPGGQWLLVRSRCRAGVIDPENPNARTHQRNARVHDASGTLLRRFLLGDGIARVQTTPGGRIWTSFFDEGVFGNLGWSQPIGAWGLLCWDHGGLLYRYSPPAGVGGIDDCYALNVPSDEEAWACYYSDFPLVRIEPDEKRVDAWDCPVVGAHAFAVGGGYALLDGGYDDHDTYHLLEIPESGELRERGSFPFADESGKRLAQVPALGRGPFLYLFRQARCYRVDLRELV
jgi:hypothetical protein